MMKKTNRGTVATLSPPPVSFAILLHLCSPRLSKFTNFSLEAKFAELLIANWPRQTSQLLSIITWNGTLTSERPLWLPECP